LIRILLFLQQIFTLWMLVDAVRRRSRFYWYLIILMPFGEWAYFLVVKIHDPMFDGIRATFERWTTRRVPIQSLRERLERAPTCDGHLAVGHALYDEQHYLDALEHFIQARRLDDGEPDAVCGIARCRIALEEFETAIALLERLIETDSSFRDYLAWKELAYALVKTDQRDAAIDRLEQLVETSPRLEHRILLANYLLHAERHPRALEEVELGLQEFERAPGFLKRRDRAWARAARKLKREIRSPQKS
jgi:hypothetical protein